ncbi:hypothetical protein [Massilia sp. S19_KUP03_FR1]|uniref:hypothetical protein n=1 Tax=Massilia sp. S19_KUP03_FR1 TaxID=3025503 RepID=UPI002FCDD60F
MGKQGPGNGAARSAAATSSVVAHGIPGAHDAIDIGHAIDCSHIETLRDKPYPCQFTSQGAFDAWRNALADTDISTSWSASQTSSQDIGDELMRQFDAMDLPSYFPEAAPGTVLAEQQMLASTISSNLKYHLSKGTVIQPTPSLEALLIHSDVDLNVPMSMVVLPYPAQYLHFRSVASEHLKLPGSTHPGHVFDGVFCFFTPRPTMGKGSIGKEAEGWILELIFACKRHGQFTGHVLMHGKTDRGATTVASWLDQVLRSERQH